MKNIRNFNDAKLLSKKAQQNIKGGRALAPGESCPTGYQLCPDELFCVKDLAWCGC